MSEAVIKKFKEEDIIIEQGISDRNLYKVMSGKVVLYVNYGKEDEYLVGVLAFPKCFGEMSVLIGEPSSYTAVALTDATVLVVPEDNFEAFIQGDHKNALAIMKTMAKNLSMANMNIKMLVEELAHVGESNEPSEADQKKRKFIHKKDFYCPNCGHEFRDEYCERLDGDEDQDFIDSGIEPAWYEVITCPKCYFSIMEKYFVKNVKIDKSVYEDKLARRRAQVKLDFNKKRDLEHVITRHQLALDCALGLYKSLQMRVHIWDNLCKLYEQCGNAECLADARRKEVDECKKIYLNVELNPKQEQKLCMKIAELYYQLHDVEGTKEWIKVAYKNGVKDDEFIERARQMMNDLKGE